DWPYNVRQLENVLRNAVLHTEGELRAEHLPEEIARRLGERVEGKPEQAALPIELKGPRDVTPDAAQLAAILKHFDGNVSQIATYVGKDRKQVYRWAERLGIELSRGKGSE